MAIEPIKGFYVHDESTDTDGVAKYDYQSVDGEPVGCADIDILIGTNRYLDNGAPTAANNSKRASTFPTMAPSKVINIYPQNGCGVCVYQRKTDGIWEQITDGAPNTNYSVALTGTGEYFCQVVSTTDIPANTTPFKLSYGVENNLSVHETKLAYCSEVPLDIEIGVNRYVENGSLIINQNAGRSRASVAPFVCAVSNYIAYAYTSKDEPGRRYHRLTVYKSSDGVTWEEIVTAQTGEIEIAVNKGDLICFHIDKKQINGSSNWVQFSEGDNIVRLFANVGELGAQGVKDIDVVDIHERKKQETSVFKLKKSSNENYTDCDLKVLFVTDIHGETERTQRAVELVNGWGSSYFDAILNGGDTCVLTDTESLAWYNSIVSSSIVPVLNTVGNHDAWSSLGVLETDPKIPYNLIIAPVANSTNIVQPANASANGYNYYYKDFNSKVRVIVIDCMFWDNAQKTWLDGVLSDARTNGLHVVCVTHASFPWADMETVDCLWSKAGFLDGYSDAAAINDPTRTNIQAAASVKDFIDAGGSFVCWLTGHQHGDDVHILPNYGNQFVVTMPSFVQRASMLQKNDDNTTYNYDVLTYIAVDTTNKNVKFSRIGANIDMYGVEHNGISIDYENKKLIASW